MKFLQNLIGKSSPIGKCKFRKKFISVLWLISADWLTHFSDFFGEKFDEFEPYSRLQRVIRLLFENVQQVSRLIKSPKVSFLTWESVLSFFLRTVIGSSDLIIASCSGSKKETSKVGIFFSDVRWPKEWLLWLYDVIIPQKLILSSLKFDSKSRFSGSK